MAETLMFYPGGTFLFAGNQLFKLAGVRTPEELSRPSIQDLLRPHGLRAEPESYLTPALPTDDPKGLPYESPALLAACLLLPGLSARQRDSIVACLCRDCPEWLPALAAAGESSAIVLVNAQAWREVKRSPQPTFDRGVLEGLNPPPSLGRYAGPSWPVFEVRQLPRLLDGDYPLEAAAARYRVPHLENAYEEATYLTSGYAETLASACEKAIAEGYERFASAGPAPRRLRTLETERLLGSERLFAYLGISRADHLAGKLVCRPGDRPSHPVLEGAILNGPERGRTWPVPLDVACYPIRPADPRRFTFATSSGVATWTTRDGAASRALLEYAERHYLLDHWLHEEPLTRLDAGSLPAELRSRLAALNALGLGTVELRLAPRAPIPCAYALLRGGDWPAFHLTGAAGIDAAATARKALDELANAVLFCEAFRQKIPLEEGEVRSATGHYAFYHDPRRLPLLDRWLAGPELAWNALSEKERPPADVAGLAGLLEPDLGEITLVDLTPEESGAPLFTVRALARDGIPLWFGRTDLPVEKPALRDLAPERIRCRWLHPMG